MDDRNCKSGIRGISVIFQNGAKANVLRWAIYKRPHEIKFEPLNISNRNKNSYDQLYSSRQLTQPTPEMRMPSSNEYYVETKQGFIEDAAIQQENFELELCKFDGKAATYKDGEFFCWKEAQEFDPGQCLPAQPRLKAAGHNHLLRIKRAAEWLQGAAALRSKLNTIANFRDSRGGSLLVSKLLKADACCDGTVSLDSLVRAVHDTAARATTLVWWWWPSP